jgi:hypothetical protein
MKYFVLRFARPKTDQAAITDEIGTEEPEHLEMPHLIVSGRLNVILELLKPEHACQEMLELTNETFRPGFGPFLTESQQTLFFSDLARLSEISVRFYVLLRKKGKLAQSLHELGAFLRIK